MAERTLRFNQDQSKKEDAIKGLHGWKGSTRTGTLVITNEKLNQNKKYIVDGFENKTGYVFDKIDLWYSFDTDFHNFHIVPDKTVKINVPLDDWLSVKLYYISEKVKQDVYVNKVKARGSQICPKNGVNDCAYNHWWFSVKTEKNEYLLSFNRLWCKESDNKIYIHNNFGQAQFMCFPKESKESGEEKEYGQINLFRGDGKFKLMYPTSGNNHKRCPVGECGHRVYNAPCDINSSAEEIAKAFVGFIKQCEKEENA